MKKKKNRRMSNYFLRGYLASWNYIKESKKFIYAIITFFFIFALIGFFIPAPEIISNSIILFIQNLLEKTQGMSQLELINFIFLNNLQSCFVGFLFGFFLGLFPIVVGILNGYVLGFVGKLAVEKGGIFVLGGLFPHGIFELPAIFISLGFGLRLGFFIFQKNIGENFKECFFNGLKVFILVVIPLLIIAAIIEGSLISLF